MPPSLSKALSRPPSAARDWATVLYLPEALVALVLVRLGLLLFGLRGLRRVALPAALGASGLPVETTRLTRAVRAGARLLPFASCLTQAQAAQILLARRGIDSTLCLGVRRTATGALAAHAWLNVGGRTLLGGAPREVGSFRQLGMLGAVR